MTTRELTVYVEDANRDPVVNREVTCILKEPAIWGDAMIQNTTPLRELTNDDGRVIFNLIPSALFNTETPYVIDWLDLGEPYEVLMPNRNAILGRLVGNAPIGPTGSIEIRYNGDVITTSADVINLNGAGLSVLDQDGVVDVIVPGLAGAVGYYATDDVDFDAASHCMTLNIPEIMSLTPPFGTFVLALFADTIERNIVDPIQARVNVGGRERPLLNRDQNPVSASQLTPERAHFLWFSSAGWILVDPLGLRPQDYLIWCGYSDTFVDAATPFYDASNFTDSFDTNAVTFPAALPVGQDAVTTRGLLAFPVDTTDLDNYIATPGAQGSGSGNLDYRWGKVADISVMHGQLSVVTLAGIDYYVWLTGVNWSEPGETYITGQAPPPDL